MQAKANNIIAWWGDKSSRTDIAHIAAVKMAALFLTELSGYSSADRFIASRDLLLTAAAAFPTTDVQNIFLLLYSALERNRLTLYS